MNQSKHLLKQTLFLLGSILFIFGCNSHSNSNSNIGLKEVSTALGQVDQTSRLQNKVEQASFKYTHSDVFKTGKVSKPQLIFSADTLIHYGGKKYQVKLNYFDVRKAIFGVGFLATANTTVLLFTKEKQFHFFEVKGVGSFEFMGCKEDQNYFRLSSKECTINFSLNLNAPDVRLTEYTVGSE
jgi:hypothetical protein